MGWHQILSFLCFLSFLHSSLPFASPLCRPYQRDALLLFKNSFVLDSQASLVCDWPFLGTTSYPKTNSWSKGVDCCSWDGVTCDDFTGNVLGLNLTCSWLHGTLHSNSSLFLLSHLRSLNLFGNNFTGSPIPPYLSAFPNMTHLNLSRSQFLGTVPSEISRLSKLVSLDLSDNIFWRLDSISSLKLENSIFTTLVRNLTVLRNLALDGVNMSSVSPMSFANLSSSLTQLSISSCSLWAIFPDTVFRLPSLTTLDLSYNYDMLGTLPKSNWTGPLESLNVMHTSFSGEIPSSISNMKSLAVLNLYDCKFTGHIPSSVAELKQLQLLDLGRNDFNGFVELEISANTRVKYSLPKLEVLRLPSCNLTKFPCFLNSSKRLTELTLSSNRISGEIQLLHWKRLLYVDLGNNSFQGSVPTLPPPTTNFVAPYNSFTEIPSSFCQSSSLGSLILSNNNLSGNVPSCFGNLTNLRDLDLSWNKLQGPLPRLLVKCVNLSILYLSHNEFSDIFPHWLELRQLRHLDLQFNKFHGRINLTTFGLSFPSLDFLVISNNNLTGRWPTEGFSNTSLRIIDLSNNKFGGPIPLPSPASFFYSIANNNVTGKIPSSLCDAIGLEFINLSNNSLTGTLPQCLTNLSTVLQVLNLRMNRLEGTIPNSFSSGNTLTTLDLSRNGFEGTLPRSLVKCKYLEVLDLSDNRIEDTFPRWLGTLPELNVLVLRSNHLKGLLNIPKGAHLFPKLHILDLSNNDFRGVLPANSMMNLKGMMDGEKGRDESLYMTQFFQSATSYENSITMTIKGQEIELVRILTIFTTIDLSHNSFEGDIPGDIGHLHSLIGLNLSHNYLTGYIPSTLGNLTNLGWLDLSSNKLSGGVPRNLADLAALGYLNLSKNQLSGRIPQDKQLSTFSSDSFSGNPGLCGTPLPKACPGDAQPPPPLSSSPIDRKKHKSWFKHETVWIGYASGVVIGMSTAYIAFEMGRPVWLARGVRMLERRAAEWMGQPKWKAIRFHVQ